MKIDKVSTNIIKTALFIDVAHPGFVSELWIEGSLKSKIKEHLPTTITLPNLIEETHQLIESEADQRRKQYLKEIFDCLIFQLEALSDSTISFAEFSKHAYGFTIKRVSVNIIAEIESNIKNLENALGLSRQEVFKKQKIKKTTLLSRFETHIQEVKSLLPQFITDFPDLGFTFDLVTNKPWSAFNSHLAPFSSKLSINTDAELTDFDLYHLAFHEAYGGHHSELSQKDKLLQQGRGEHGLVITFSPQTFISEAIAEGVYTIFQSKKSDLEQQMVWNYNRLIFALQNLSTYMFFDDNKSREEVDQELRKYNVSTKARKNILDFSTDKLFGKYAPIYYTAYDFFRKVYDNTTEKEKFVKTLFTQPCTPKLLIEEFGI